MPHAKKMKYEDFNLNCQFDKQTLLFCTATEILENLEDTDWQGVRVTTVSRLGIAISYPKGVNKVCPQVLAVVKQTLKNLKWPLEKSIGKRQSKLHCDFEGYAIVLEV